MRFIPACAGNSLRRRRSASRWSVHPRVRGEQLTLMLFLSAPDGSSPRARGTGALGTFERDFQRFIPACAGNSWPGSAGTVAGSVHPRVRGEQTAKSIRPVAFSGSSPRARGTDHHQVGQFVVHRFIPACAGNRVHPQLAAQALKVHPRVRGEQTLGLATDKISGGSSPRARGTEALPALLARQRRFIPACAGNSLQKST